jgi:hypothetical protein
MDHLPDTLSPLARQVMKINADSAYQQLVVNGPGNAEAKQLLDGAGSEELFQASSGKSEQDRMAALSGLWLWDDWLDISHTISQSLHSSTGSFWHAIMHRREGDFSNSKYWYARCADHPAMNVLAAQAQPAVNTMPADKTLFRLIATGWNPNALVDLVEEVHDRPADPRYAAAVQLQRLEWQILFDHCARK